MLPHFFSAAGCRTAELETEWLLGPGSRPPRCAFMRPVTRHVIHFPKAGDRPVSWPAGWRGQAARATQVNFQSSQTALFQPSSSTRSPVNSQGAKRRSRARRAGHRLLRRAPFGVPQVRRPEAAAALLPDGPALPTGAGRVPAEPAAKRRLYLGPREWFSWGVKDLGT